MICTVCNDTGKLPGSEYLDCTNCSAANDRAKLEKFTAPMRDSETTWAEDNWAIHQRARQIEREVQAARIEELQARLECALSGKWAHASPSAPAVVQAQPVRWLMPDGSCTAYRKYGEGYGGKPLYLDLPLATDADKVREALTVDLSGLTRYGHGEMYIGDDCDFGPRADGGFYSVQEVAELVASMAPQAPVREVPGWISVKDRLPVQGVPVFVYTPANKYSDERIDFDCIDPEDDTASTWDQHNQHYEHWCCVAKPEGSIGPSAEAPYTHWMAFPEAPAQQEGDKP